MNNPIDSIVMCNDRLPAKSGVYKIKNNSGCNNGDGEVYYSVDTGWDIPESIRSFYKVLGWVE